PGCLTGHGRCPEQRPHDEQLPRHKTTEGRQSNAASYAVQAEVSPCTAHGERASWPCRVKGSLRCATPLRALDPMRHRAPATKKTAAKEGRPDASSRVRGRLKPLQGVSAYTLAGMSGLTGCKSLNALGLQPISTTGCGGVRCCRKGSSRSRRNRRARAASYSRLDRWRLRHEDPSGY